MRRSKSIVATISAALGSFCLVLFLHREALRADLLSITCLAWLVLGLLYTQLVEFWYHLVPMHRGFRFFDHVKISHQEHHRIFHSANFRTRNVEDLKHVTGRWSVFPAVFILHYLVLRFLLPSPALVAFFAGVALHYAAFELTHWFTHVEDNSFDRWIGRVPVLNRIRETQILHHLIHHEIPTVAFNFNPPFLGDVAMGTMPMMLEGHGLAGGLGPAPAASPVSAPIEPNPQKPHLWARPAVKYGSAVAVGFVALGVGVAVLAWGRLPRSKWPASRGATL